MVYRYDPFGLGRAELAPTAPNNVLDDSHWLVAQVTHQHFANEVLQTIFRCNAKSKLRTLALSPRARTWWLGPTDGDANGHVHPDYYYVKSTGNHPFRGYRVVALPTVYRDLEELEGVSILERELA